MQSLGFEAKNQTIYQMIGIIFGIFLVYIKLWVLWFILGDIDKDGSGSIDFEEFLDMMTAKMVIII